jgi:hypothetical protein
MLDPREIAKQAADAAHRNGIDRFIQRQQARDEASLPTQLVDYDADLGRAVTQNLNDDLTEPDSVTNGGMAIGQRVDYTLGSVDAMPRVKAGESPRSLPTPQTKAALLYKIKRYLRTDTIHHPGRPAEVIPATFLVAIGFHVISAGEIASGIEEGWDGLHYVPSATGFSDAIYFVPSFSPYEPGADQTWRLSPPSDRIIASPFPIQATFTYSPFGSVNSWQFRGLKRSSRNLKHDLLT